MKKCLLFLFLLLTSVSIWAYDAEIDGIYYYYIDGIWYNLDSSTNTAQVTECIYYYYSGDVVIPEKVVYDGSVYSVSSIGDWAFAGCDDLTSVTIPNSVISIGENAFFSCHGLTSISIPASVTSIGDYAFFYCSGLTSVTILASVTSIGSLAFYYCSGLTKAEFASIESLCQMKFESAESNPLYYAHHLYIDGKEVTDVIIPESVTSIGNRAFFACSGLTSVTIPASVTSIGSSAFYYCSGLTKAEFASIESLCQMKFESYGSNPLCYAHHLYIDGKEVTDVIIPESVTSIGSYAFFYCNGLTSVTIPNSVTEIGSYAFYHCSGLTSIVVNEGNTTYDSRNGCNAIIETVSNTLIAGCSNTIIPTSVTSIGSYAFSGCSGLTSVTIPNSVTSIGSSAFYYCSGLTSIVIPETVRSIGKSAFMYCDEVEALVCLVKNPFAICGKGEEGATFSDYFFNAVPLYVPEGTAETYRETEGWKDFANIIEGLPTGIGEIAGDEAVKGKWSNGECYGLDGRRQDARHRGISILRHADGSVRKVLKK